LNRALGLMLPRQSGKPHVIKNYDPDPACAICDEIGERLRTRLKPDMPTSLPPRLQH
jgi:hypothetical protein